MRLLQMSLSGAVLIIVVAAVRAAMKNILPKITFLLLWGIALFRLLIPYMAQSTFSIYTIIGSRTPVSTAAAFPTVSPQAPVSTAGSFALLVRIIWLIGMALCVLFFTGAYLYWHYVFQTSLPVQNDFVAQWQHAHKKTSSILVRQSDRIAAPLSYGFLQAVILMPRKTDWNNTRQLEYIFMHEYIHICRHDSALKLVSTLVLCIHWFNPLVWLMYLMLQRDIELACDESVIRRFGEASKRTYANMLINMEVQKDGPMPLCNNFGKNAIEERITAIMKMKKTSVLKMLSSAAIIACITVLFATTASAKKTGLEGYRTGYVNTDALKLREEASASASVSSLLMEMQQVTILSEKDGFYHISVPGEGQLDGWVKKEYVRIED